MVNTTIAYLVVILIVLLGVAYGERRRREREMFLATPTIGELFEDYIAGYFPHVSCQELTDRLRELGLGGKELGWLQRRCQGDEFRDAGRRSRARNFYNLAEGIFRMRVAPPDL